MGPRGDEDRTSARADQALAAISQRACPPLAETLAFVVLTGLAERFASPRDAARARALRDRLALLAPPEHSGRALLGALWSASGTPR